MKDSPHERWLRAVEAAQRQVEDARREVCMAENRLLVAHRNLQNLLVGGWMRSEHTSPQVRTMS